VVSGVVKGIDGTTIQGAVLDVWQTAPNGLYHVQDKDQPEHHLCGKVHADAHGNYSFRTLKPVSYPIPTDGPVGKMLKQMGRHPFRPAHIHFIVSAPGYKPVITQLFSEGDAYIETDSVFGVKNSLVVDYRASGDEWMVDYDFVLEPVSNA
jgi:catechol 1,2-dioxygenase